MYNKKVLSTATKNLNKAKAPAKPKDTTIYDQQGQRNHPGKVTTILGDTMATDGYGYIPLMVYPNNGQPPQLVMPNTGPRHFLGATEFTEVPVNEDELDYYDDELTDDEIEELKRGGYIVEDLPTAQIGLIKSPYKMPAGVTHPMQVPTKKPTVKPTRTYDPLTDVKPQVSESTKPINTPTIDKNLADKMIAQKAAQRQATVEAVKAQPTLSQQEKTDILLNNDKLDSYDYLTDLKGPDTVKESTPQSAGSRAWDIITNPFDAFEYAVRTGDISNMPHNYNAMRMAGIDPSAGQGSNLVGNFLNTSYNLFDAGDKVVRNIGEGNYGEALLQGSRFIPGSRVSTGLGSKLYKATAKAPSVPGMPSYGKDLWYSATHGRKIPTYKTATRWQPDAYPESLVQAGKKELTPEQQSLTGSWYGYSPGNKKVNPDASSAVGFYMRTRPGAGNINTLKLSQRQIDELEAAMPDFAKGMSGKTNTQATSTDWVKGELNVPLEVRQKAKTTRFDVNPREYVPTQLDSNIDPTSIYARLKGDIETGTFVNDLIESQYKPIMGIPRKYFPYKKGGSLPNIPKKKNSKGYSRSLMATNQLFAQNPLTKKSKSKKRKIFNPNSKYYEVGGFHTDINKRRQVLRDWTYGADIGMLHKAQFGDVGVRTSEEEIKRIQEAKAKELSYARTPAQKEEVTKRFDKLLQDAGYRVQIAKQQQKEAPKKVVKTIVDASDKAKAQRIAAEQKNLQNRTVGAGPGTSTYVTPTKIDVPVSLTPLEEKAIIDENLQRSIGKGYLAEAYGDEIYNQPTTDKYFAGVRPKEIPDNYYDLATAKKYGDTDFKESLFRSFEDEEKFDEDIEDAQYNIWKRGEQARFNQAPWYNVMLNELTSFIGDPVLATSNALSGKRNLYGQGYRSVAPEDFEDARFYDRANERTQAGLIGSGVANIFNPAYYGGKAGYNVSQGDYGEAIGDLGQAYLAGTYAGLGKGSLPGLSKLPGATGQNLVKADMAASSLYGTPETLSTAKKIITGEKDEYGDPVTLDWINALDLGFTAAGYKQMAPLLKEGIPALKNVKVDMSKLKQIAPAVKSSLKKKLNRNNLNTIDLQGLTFAQGGQTSWEGEYTDEELEQLKQDGYQIEYLD